jgi:hypothetical protein
MIIDDLDFKSITVPPFKANTALAIDPNAILPFAVALKSFEIIGWRNTQIVKRGRGIKLSQTTLGSSNNISGKSFWRLSGAYRLQSLVFRRLDHALNVFKRDTSVKVSYPRKIQYFRWTER